MTRARVMVRTAAGMGACLAATERRRWRATQATHKGGNAMVTIEVEDDNLLVSLRGWDKGRALRSKLVVPLRHITGVRAHPREAFFDDVIVNSSRGVGMYIPGRLAIGTVELSDGPAFYDVRDPHQAVAIDLAHEPLHHLVLEVVGESPEAAVQRIEHAVWH
jgi:hypothetical protein